MCQRGRNHRFDRRHFALPQRWRHGPSGLRDETLIAHSLRAEGFDASEDGTGRGTPLVPVAFAQNSRDEVRCIGGNIAGAIAAEPGMKQQTYIAFTAKDHGADASDISPTLRSGSHSGSHANGGVMPAVAFDWNNRREPEQRRRSAGLWQLTGTWRQCSARPCAASPRASANASRASPTTTRSFPIAETRCRWAALQGARQLDGGSGDALDR
jgi:hypothetical protein